MRTMKTFDARKLDFEAASTYLNEEGYVVLEGLLDPIELDQEHPDLPGVEIRQLQRVHL